MTPLRTGHILVTDGVYISRGGLCNVAMNPIGPKLDGTRISVNEHASSNVKRLHNYSAACAPMNGDRIAAANSGNFSVDEYRKAIGSAGIAAGGWTHRIAPEVGRTMKDADSAIVDGAKVAAHALTRSLPAIAHATAKAAPIAGETIGAAGFILATASPAGNTDEASASAMWRQRSNAVSDRVPQETHTVYPGHSDEVGSNHTTRPAASPLSVKDRIHVTPVVASPAWLHTGHFSLDLDGLTTPTGTAVEQPTAVDHATLKNPENTVAEQISNGHSWGKHQNEFPGWSHRDFTQAVEKTMKNPDSTRTLLRERTAYWNQDDKMVVIHDPSRPDAGTAFRPSTGKAYFDRALK